LLQSLTDHQQGEHRDQCRIGKAGQQRVRSEQADTVRIRQRREVEQQQQGSHDAEGHQFQSHKLCCKQCDRREDDHEGCPHLHARLASGSAKLQASGADYNIAVGFNAP